MQKGKFIFYTPFTGLGLYGGHRGKRWLKNRIAIFEHFVIPSLLNQQDRDFLHWISWRPEDRGDPIILALEKRLAQVPNYNFVFTYGGVCFWDDKYEDEVARNRLFHALHESLPALLDLTSDCTNVYMMLQPSDDLYIRTTVSAVKGIFSLKPDVQAVTFTKGYLCNYSTKELKEYNPNTNPPFFAINFPRNIFFDPGRHMTYFGPYKSHEYIGEKLRLAQFSDRGFLVGTHGENISTHFNHPFGGKQAPEKVLDDFGILDVPPLTLPVSIRKVLLRKLPHGWQRKLRYWWGEKIYAWFYNFIRS